MEAVVPHARTARPAARAALSQRALRVVLFFGEHVSQADHSIKHLVTQQSLDRLSKTLGDRRDQASAEFDGIYVVERASGTMVTSGRY